MSNQEPIPSPAGWDVAETSVEPAMRAYYVVRVNGHPRATYAAETLQEAIDLTFPTDEARLEVAEVSAPDTATARLMNPPLGWAGPFSVAELEARMRLYASSFKPMNLVVTAREASREEAEALYPEKAKLANLSPKLLAKRDEITSRIATYRQPGQPVQPADLEELEAVMAEINRREEDQELASKVVEMLDPRRNPREWNDFVDGKLREIWKEAVAYRYDLAYLKATAAPALVRHHCQWCLDLAAAFKARPEREELAVAYRVSDFNGGWRYGLMGPDDLYPWEWSKPFSSRIEAEHHAREALRATTSQCTCRGVYLGGNYPGAHLPGCPDLHGKRGLTEDEAAVMGHCRHFGSDGYGAYVTKCGKGWTWGTDRVAGPPVVFKTRREAVASFEAFLDILRDALAGRV